MRSPSSADAFMILGMQRLVRSLAHTGLKGFAGARFSGLHTCEVKRGTSPAPQARLVPRLQYKSGLVENAAVPCAERYSCRHQRFFFSTGS